MVVIAYGVTIGDAFSTISTDPNRNGPGFAGVGCIWLWMLPVTIGAHPRLNRKFSCSFSIQDIF
jgi:hypothetical protein